MSIALTILVLIADIEIAVFIVRHVTLRRLIKTSIGPFPKVERGQNIIRPKFLRLSGMSEAGSIVGV